MSAILGVIGWLATVFIPVLVATYLHMPTWSAVLLGWLFGGIYALLWVRFTIKL